MSIAGVSAASSAAYLQQLQNAKADSTAFQASAATTVQTTTTPAPTAAAPAQIGQSHHHHHHHGGSGGAAELTQSGTTSAEASNILNTLV